jgi:hypothetical protein
MSSTPEDRAARPQRRFRHGPYHAVVWGNTINVHYGDDTASPIYSKTMKGQIGDANMSELARVALPEIAKDHEMKRLGITKADVDKRKQETNGKPSDTSALKIAGPEDTEPKK